MILQSQYQAQFAAGERRRRVALAAEAGQQCAACGRAMPLPETVWRIPLRVESEWQLQPQLWVAPVCATCRPWPLASHQPRPCSHCGRGVVSAADDYWPWTGHTFCSDACAAGWWDRERRHADDLIGGLPLEDAGGSHPCLACGRGLTGRRTTCSVACRQRLYRMRKRQDPAGTASAWPSPPSAA